MEQAAREFLRAIRGRRSQQQWARRLGYRGNPVTDWERGVRFPTASEMFRALSLSGLDLAAASARFDDHATLTRDPSGHWDLSAWLERLRGSATVAELAARCGRSRFSVSRWLSGKTKPRVPDYFRLLDAITGRLPEWVAQMVPVDEVPSLSGRYQAMTLAKRLAFEVPWSEAILRLLETERYWQAPKHREGMLAQTLGIPVELERQCLMRLKEARLVSVSRGKYRVKGCLTVDTRGGQEALHALKHHWLQVATARARHPQRGDVFAYNVVSLARTDLDKVRELLKATFREIRALVAASQPEEVAALVSLQLLTFEK